MAGRLRIILGFALLGFLAGVIAYLTYKEIGPLLVKVFPFLLTAEWFISGLAGAGFTLVMIVLWAYVSKS